MPIELRNLKEFDERLNKRLLLIGALSGIVGPPLTLSMVIIAVLLAPWFSWYNNALSDLGISDVANLFNGALILGGISGILFSLGLREALKSKNCFTLGITIFMMGSLSLILVGIFTEFYGSLHFYFSASFFLLTPIGMIIIGLSRIKILGFYGYYGIFAGIISLIIIFQVVIPVLKGAAIPEILSSLTIASWIISLSTKILKF
ncbi:MAG: DUF998 domain-containing protein [Nitrososphaerales archaeon]